MLAIDNYLHERAISVAVMLLFSREDFMPLKPLSSSFSFFIIQQRKRERKSDLPDFALKKKNLCRNETDFRRKEGCLRLEKLLNAQSLSRERALI